MALFVPHFFEEKLGDIVFPSILPPLFLCMKLLLQFYAGSFQTLHVLGTNVLFSVLQLLFFPAQRLLLGIYIVWWRMPYYY